MGDSASLRSLLRKWGYCHVLVMGGIIFFVVFYILPDYRRLTRKNIQIEELKAKIKNQERLFPYYEKLLKKITDLQALRYLPFSSRDALDQGETDLIFSDIRRLARSNGFGVRGVTPYIRSLNDKTAHMEVEIFLEGPFLKLRNFLIGLNKLKYLEYIEQIHVDSQEEFQVIRLRVRVAQK